MAEPVARTLRVLHCPTDVGGLPRAFAAAERELGLESRAVTFTQSRLRYASDHVLWQPGERRLSKEWKRWALVVEALRRYDVIHYHFGATLVPGWEGLPPPGAGATYVLRNRLQRALWMRDLSWFARAGKAVVVSFAGDDVRQGDYCRWHFAVSPAPYVDADYYTPQSDARKRAAVTRFDQHADQLYALTPDLLHVVPERAQFLPTPSVDPRRWQVYPPGAHDVPVVVHAPTHRGVKGTRFVLSAVDRLRAEGVPFEFVLVENLTHREVETLYRRADLCVDQLLVGWYGTLAVEFMAMGKPVICYLREEDQRRIPDPMRRDLPIVSATPDSIYYVLRSCLAGGRVHLRELGRRGRTYVERWHHPLRIAERVKSDYVDALRRKNARVRRPRRQAGGNERLL